MHKQFQSRMRGAVTRTKIRSRISSLSHGLIVVAAVLGTSCASEDETALDSNQDEVDLGVALEGLGTNFTECTAADSTAFVAASKQLTIPLTANKDAVLSVVNGKIKVNGWQCSTAAVVGPPAVAAFDLTSTNVNKIIFSSAAATNKIVVDMLPGAFGNIFSGTGGVVVQGTGMSVGVRGTGAANNVKVGQEGTGGTGPFYFELSGDARADVKIEGNPGSMSFALGDGADTFSAQGQALTTTALGGSAVTGDLTTENVSVFGGLGNDTLKGGLGDDTLNGGEGNDTFTTSAGSVDDGSDLYVGGTGTDTVDYSGRTVALNVSIAPTYDSGWVEGVDITNATVAASATLAVTVGSTLNTVTFGGSPTIGTTAILTAINTGVTGAVASVNDRGEIVIKNSTLAAALSVGSASAGTTLFGGAKSNNGVAQLTLDADDGLSGEADDVQADVENLVGGTANDVLSGSIGSNTISGGAGNDDISGGPAGSSCAADLDALNGGDGNDIFRLGTLTNCGDTVDGGAGTDVASYELRTVAGVAVTLDTTANDGEDLEADMIKTTIEVILGSSLADTITGGAGNDEIHGGAGNDMLIGGAGADTLVGGPGTDTMLGGVGEDVFNEKDVADSAFVQTILPTSGSDADVINGGADFDTADYGRTSTTDLTVSLCIATTTTGMGQCTGAADADGNDPDGDDITNVEHFIGGAGDDSITGSTGDDFIEGGGGDDSIIGGTGNDTLFGDNGNDTLVGGTGDDTLDGAAGTNSLIGGGGDDICTVGAAGVVDATTCEI
jgi:Ca2+-binding RTX toxin-like protein